MYRGYPSLLLLLLLLLTACNHSPQSPSYQAELYDALLNGVYKAGIALLKGSEEVHFAPQLTPHAS